MDQPVSHACPFICHYSPALPQNKCHCGECMKISHHISWVWENIVIPWYAWGKKQNKTKQKQESMTCFLTDGAHYFLMIVGTVRACVAHSKHHKCWFCVLCWHPCREDRCPGHYTMRNKDMHGESKLHVCIEDKTPKCNAETAISALTLVETQMVTKGTS